MDLFATMKSRQSIRAYTSKPVEDEKFRAILDAVRTAPSAGNFQPYEIYVVRDAEKLGALAGATFDQKFIAQSQLALVFCMNPDRCKYDQREYFAVQDTAIATTFAVLAIEALGLATCWVAAFVPAKIAQVLELPVGHIPVAILPIGYAAEKPERTTRREFAEFVHEI